MDKYVSLAEETAKALGDMIRNGIYQPGDRLPNEQQLADSLGVSRTSIREAVKILIASNVLFIKRGVGTFVSESPNNGYDPFNMIHSHNKKTDAIEALELRLLLEPAMIENMFHVATVSELEEIYKIEEQCRKKIEKGEAYLDLDLKFHEAIARATHNKIYEQLFPVLHSSIVIIQHSARDINRTNEFADNAHIYHAKIVECIKNNDVVGAALYSQAHVYNALTILRKLP